MGEAHFRTPTPSKPVNQFRCHAKYITTSPQGSWRAKFGWNRFGRYEKTRFVWIFLLTYLSIYLSVYLSVRFFVGATGHSFGPILTVNGSNDVILQPLVPFGGHINIAPY